MIPEKVFHQILALGEAWQVTAVDYVEKAGFLFEGFSGNLWSYTVRFINT